VFDQGSDITGIGTEITGKNWPVYNEV